MNKLKSLKGFDFGSIKSFLSRKRNITILLVCIVGVLLAVISGCTKSASSSAASQAEVTPVILSNAVISEGHLVPLSSTWLSFQTTGRVEAVLVAEGSRVVKGQALVRLEGSQRAEAELTAAQSALYLAQQNLDDAKKSGAAKAAAELALAEAQRAYNNALGDYWESDQTQGSEDQIDLYNARVIVAQDKVDRLQDDYDDMGELEDDDPKKAQALANLKQAQIDLDNLIDLRNYFRDLPDELDVQTLLAKLNVAKANLEDAQREYDRQKDGPNQDSLAGIQAAYDSARAAAEQAQWAYDQLVLKAPYDGTFVQCDLTVGEYVTVGQKVALVADLSAWKIETDDLDETDVIDIESGQSVMITADALPGMEFTGIVDSISQYYTDDNGDVLYTVKIRLENSEPQLRWGMTMQVEFQKQ